MEQGGVERVVCTLTRALAEVGHSVIVISSGGNLVRTIHAAGGRHVSLDLKSKNLLTVPLRAFRLRRLLRVERPDLVCVHSRVPAWLFLLANWSLRLPWVTYAHGANSVSRYSEIMTRGDRIIVPSKFLSDYLISNYSFDVRKLRIVPNCVDFRRFDPERLDVAFVADKRREWGLQPGDFVTMSIGRITPVKGFDHVIRDFVARSSEDKRRKLVIVGGAEKNKQSCLAELRALAKSAFPGRKVPIVFAGPQTKIPECLSLASEVISGNMIKPESFGLSVLEAYAMNVPVRLLRHFGGAAEVVDAVESVRREAQGGRSPSWREAAQSCYNFDIMSAKTLSVYKELVP